MRYPSAICGRWGGRPDAGATRRVAYAGLTANPTAQPIGASSRRRTTAPLCSRWRALQRRIMEAIRVAAEMRAGGAYAHRRDRPRRFA